MSGSLSASGEAVSPAGGSGLDSWEAITDAPAWMLPPERILLHALVRALRPKSVLEIGTFKGGSTMIMCAAMDVVGDGLIACVDPNPTVEERDWKRVAHRARMIVGSSPSALPEATKLIGGAFDFVLIDGDHSYEGVRQDIDGVLPFLQPDSYLVLHDSHYWQVSAAISDALKKHPGVLTDCGTFSREEGRTDTQEQGHPVVWGGLRVLRFLDCGASQVEPTGEASAKEKDEAVAEGAHAKQLALNTAASQPSAPASLPVPDGLGRATRWIEKGPENPWDAPSRFRLVGPLYRKLLRRLLRPYETRQREFEQAVVDALSACARSIEELNAERRQR